MYTRAHAYHYDRQLHYTGMFYHIYVYIRISHILQYITLFVVAAILLPCCVVCTCRLSGCTAIIQQLDLLLLSILRCCCLYHITAAVQPEKKRYVLRIRYSTQKSTKKKTWVSFTNNEWQEIMRVFLFFPRKKGGGGSSTIDVLNSSTIKLY